MNENNIIHIYRFSLFTNLTVSLLLLMMGKNIVNYIYWFAIYYAFSQCLYWTTYEIMIYDFNTKESFKKYFIYDNMIYNISYIIFPVAFGFILDKYSYFAIFTILSIIALISFVVSFTINNKSIYCTSINLKECRKSIKNKKLLAFVGAQSILDGLTNGGVIQMLTTLIIFSKFESESFMGSISSIIGLICVIVAFASRKIINKQNFFKIVFPITFLFFLITIPINFQTKLVFVVIYKLCVELCDLLTNIEGNTAVFESFESILNEEYKVEYQWFVEFTLAIGRAIGLIAIIVICWIFNNSITSLTILLIYFTVFYMLRTVVIDRIRKIQSRGMQIDDIM